MRGMPLRDSQDESVPPRRYDVVKPRGAADLPKLLPSALSDPTDER
jgi:hypothetical protein